ncbi:F390 synthetase-related protein [Paracoccus siganidrum]|uniref:Adenylate synthase n=1 Tax=Paracoccus siganidrum TaxID=1276757 RepID=A0A418ZSW7_9RHOB|nr:F390 synthetase-related protein [Paracoccus siganidrum]RJK99961.1 adenylate synthase [Paracoccus siganidrum]RMC35893.1 adenylate synthase [Paracoccus siganidrum]
MSLSAFLSARYGRGFRDRAQIEAHHARAFALFRQRVMPRSPFYRDLAQVPLAALPRMSKARLMENFSAINTCGIRYDQALDVALRAEESRDFSPMIGKVAVGLSTGTSGQRGLFLSTPRERALWAAIMLGRFWPSLARRQRVAFFMRADNALYRRLSNPLVRFQFFDMLTPWQDHLSRLEALDPTVVIAPARILGQLALAGPRIAPQRLISVAETLLPEDRAAITAAFGVPVDEVYQATEGVLAMTCRAGSLHLNEGWLRVERDVIDPATGAFCPIIHDFTRESLPILNYRLDDVLVPDPAPCPCGCASLRIARIEGREDDMLWWPGRAGLRLVPADAIRTMIACLPLRLRDWRAIQRGNVLEIWLDGAEGDAERPLRDALADLGRRLDCTPPELRLHAGLPPEPDAKRRRVRVLPA